MNHILKQIIKKNQCEIIKMISKAEKKLYCYVIVLVQPFQTSYINGLKKQPNTILYRIFSLLLLL